MNCQNLLYRIVVMSVVICALLGCGETEDTSSVVLSETGIEGDTSGFSGRVVDESGNPVVGLALVIQPFKLDDNTGVWTYPPPLGAETDAAGRFSITDIRPGEFQFGLAPDYQNKLHFETEYQLLSVRIGAFVHHPKDLHPSPFTRDTFSITPGVRIEDVEVTVRLRMRIRAKIVFSDGTPLANKEVDINIRAQGLHENSVGGIQGSVQTDAQGYFVQYVDRNKATRYRVSVEYKGRCATSETFVLRVGERREDLILRLDGKPIR